MATVADRPELMTFDVRRTTAPRITELRQGWVVILAAGDGTRLATLTRDANGVVIPKQFCSLSGGPSLLAQTVRRASRVVAQQRICAVVAAQHSNYWLRDLSDIPDSNIIVQPHNCGTAHGVMLAAFAWNARSVCRMVPISVPGAR